MKQDGHGHYWMAQASCFDCKIRKPGAILLLPRSLCRQSGLGEEILYLLLPGFLEERILRLSEVRSASHFQKSSCFLWKSPSDNKHLSGLRLREWICSSPVMDKTPSESVTVPCMSNSVRGKWITLTQKGKKKSQSRHPGMYCTHNPETPLTKFWLSANSAQG